MSGFLHFPTGPLEGFSCPSTQTGNGPPGSLTRPGAVGPGGHTCRRGTDTSFKGIHPVGTLVSCRLVTMGTGSCLSFFRTLFSQSDRSQSYTPSMNNEIKGKEVNVNPSVATLTAIEGPDPVYFESDNIIFRV